jgi:hypothetical protein
MPAGLVQLASPNTVLPFSLSRRFVESQAWPARVVEYHDGSSQRSPMLTRPRRSWRLVKHIPTDLVDELRAFWQAQGAAAFYFYNPKETDPPFSHDATGVATAGRYRVRFANSWSEGSTVGPLQDATIELIELLTSPPILSLALRVFSTGVDDDNAPLAAGSIDPHWRYISGPAGTPPDAICRGAYNISALAAAPVPLGDYVFELTFDMSDFVLDDAVIEGEVTGADDATTLYFNGVSLGTAFYSTLPFTIDSGFLPGINALRLKNNNSMITDEQCALQIYSAIATLL